MRAAWIGAGAMGSRMAGRLSAAGAVVLTTERDAGRVRGAVEIGSDDDLATAAAVVTMLPGPIEVADVWRRRLFGRVRPGTLLIDMSTSSPALAAELSVEAEALGVRAIDAPVSGGPAGADNGTLSVFAGGEADAIEQARTLFAAFADRVVHHGPAGFGQRAKLVNQVGVAAATAAVAEMHSLATVLGLDHERLLESLAGGAAASPLLSYLWGRLAEGDGRPGFRSAHLVKDLDLLAAAAAPTGHPLFVASTSRALFAASTLARPADGTQSVIGLMQP